jgi:hypothetical protein
MGLDSQDKKPQGMLLIQAYDNIGQWYLENLPLLPKEWGHQPELAKKSEALIKALPPASKLTELEIRAVLAEVISGCLEWGITTQMGSTRWLPMPTAPLKQRVSSIFSMSQRGRYLKAAPYGHISKCLLMDRKREFLYSS